jgi:uncharacterized protein
MNNVLTNIPYRGIGIRLKEEIANLIKQRRNDLDVLEIITECYIDKPPKAMESLKKLRDQFSVIPHGVKLSIGSALPLNYTYLKKVKRLCEFINPYYYSDHFALTNPAVNMMPETEIGHLYPIWFTKEVLNIIVQKTNEVQKFLGLPLVLENITSDFVIPEADLEEPEFITEVCQQTNCGLLLDLTNVHIVSFNRDMDPTSWLSRFPLEYVVQIHLAGGKVSRPTNWYHDTHSEELNGVNEGMWPLLEYVGKNCKNLKAVIIERDSNFKENFDEMILNDVRRIRAIIESTKRML